MLFSDININDVRGLMEKSRNLPAAPLLYLINFAGLTDEYMHNNKMEYTSDNIGFLAIYHKLYHSLPSDRLNLSKPNENTAKALLLSKMLGQEVIFSETSLEEDCNNYAKKNRRLIEDTLYPILVDCETDPLSNLNFSKIMRSCGGEVEIEQGYLDYILSEECDSLEF